MRLNSRTKKSAQTRIDEKYQGHVNALTKDGLAPNIFPSLKEIWKKLDASKTSNDARWENRSWVEAA